LIFTFGIATFMGRIKCGFHIKAYGNGLYTKKYNPEMPCFQGFSGTLKNDSAYQK